MALAGWLSPAAAQLPGQLVPQGSPIPRILPPSQPSTAPAAQLPTGRAQGPSTAGQTVAVRSVAVEGATAYVPADLARMTAGVTGTQTRAQLDAVGQTILDRYRADRYAFTSVKWEVDGAGNVRFIVIEGHISDVKLDGDIGPAGTQVLRFLNRLTEVRPIDTTTLERWLLLAQDVPGVTVRAVIRPSTDEPGALTLVAQVSRQSWNALFTADNRSSPYTGPAEALAVLSANSFTSLGERTDVSIYHSIDNTQTFGQVLTEAFAGSSGLKIRIYGGDGNTDPSGQLHAINYQGVTATAGAAALYPLIRERQQTLNLGVYFDLLESSIDTGAQHQLASRDNLRVLRLGADYVLQDLLLGGDRSAVNSLGVRFSHGLSVLGASREGDPLAGRVNQNINFTKVSFEASRTQTLFSPWEDATVAFQGTVAGQYSNDIMPPAEQFFLGGIRWNRGYYAGEVTGDKALTAALELQLNTGFTMTLFSTPLEVGTQFYAFTDWGETWQNQKQDLNHKLTSLGIGVRATVTRYTEFDLEGVVRGNLRPLGGGANVNPLSPQAIYWRFLARF